MITVMKVLALLVCSLLMFSVLAGCFESDDDPGRKRGKVGEYKYDYLRNEKYTAVIIEIDHVEGFAPSSDAKNTLKARINTYCDKTTVTIKQNSFESSDSSYSLQEIVKLEERHRTEWRGGSTIVIHILYLDGEYSESGNTLGIAYFADSIAIFKEKIQETADTSLPILVTEEDIEKAVLVHEFGHLAGLVNIGYESDADHEDPDYEHHCVHEDCVMNAQLESNAIINLINSGGVKPPDDFETDCKADLRGLKDGTL